MDRVANAAPLPSSAPVGSWDLTDVSGRARDGERRDRQRTILRSGIPLVVVTFLLALVGGYLFTHPSPLFLVWLGGLAVFDAILVVSLVLLLRLHQEALRRPLGSRLELTAESVRLVPDSGTDANAVEVPLAPGRVFVSPPGVNQPRREPGGGFRPRAFVRLEPAGRPALAAAVPDEAARAVHRAMSRRASFGLGYDRARNPLTRTWILYEGEGAPGAATGVLADLPAAKVWSPAPEGYLSLHRGGKQINV